MPGQTVAHSQCDHRRNLVSFWIFGLTNNFAYVVMLSAANDLLTPLTNATHSAAENRTGHLVPYCNPLGTGAVLLADILPTLAVKLCAPFLLQHVPYWLSVLCVVLLGAASFPVVSRALRLALILLGVVLASLGAGYGEVTFLAMTSFYHRNTVSAWASGTGAAGVAGAASYAGLTAAGVRPRLTLLVMTVVPFTMALVYWTLLTKATQNTPKVTEGSEDGTVQVTWCDAADDADEATPLVKPEQLAEKLTCRERLSVLLSLHVYIVPLTLIYVFEYFMNQALFELVTFHMWIPRKQQYRWYQLIYQVGVFLSRSSVNLVHFRRVWIFTILQAGLLVVMLCDVFYHFLPSVWLMFALILAEGLLAGAAYVNTFYRVYGEVPARQLEYSLAAVSMSDSLGVTAAGVIAIPVHNLLCSL